MRSPSAPILRGSVPSGSHQQPGWPSRRAAATPYAAQVATRAASSARTSGRTSSPRADSAQDRIGDQLAGAVIGHLAAALDPDDLDPASGKRGRVGADVGRVGGAAEGQDRRMLEEQQLVADPSLRTLGDEALLELERLAVVRPVRATRRRSAPRRGSIRSAPAASVSITTSAG